MLSFTNFREMMPFLIAVGQVLASRASFGQLRVPLLDCSKTAPITQTFSLRPTIPGILMRTASPKAFH